MRRLRYWRERARFIWTLGNGWSHRVLVLLGVVRSPSWELVRADVRCSCPWTPPSTWTTHYGAVEPGSMREHDPGCLEHGTRARDDTMRQ